MNKPFAYSTFTLAAFDYDLSPILLLSDLSEHTKNIQEKKSASLMLCEERRLYKFFPKFDNKFSSYEDPMSRPRVTLIGKLKKTRDPNHKKRFMIHILSVLLRWSDYFVTRLLKVDWNMKIEWKNNKRRQLRLAKKNFIDPKKHLSRAFL